MDFVVSVIGHCKDAPDPGTSSCPYQLRSTAPSLYRICSFSSVQMSPIARVIRSGFPDYNVTHFPYKEKVSQIFSQPFKISCLQIAVILLHSSVSTQDQPATVWQWRKIAISLRFTDQFTVFTTHLIFCHSWVFIPHCNLTCLGRCEVPWPLRPLWPEEITALSWGGCILTHM